MTQSNVMAAAFAHDMEPMEAAYQATLPEIMALPDEETVQLNLEPVAAATVALGVLPELLALRPRIEKELPSFDLQRFDKLKQYTLAFTYAHGLYRGAQVPTAQLAALAEELTVIRDRLLGDAASLGNNGYLDASRLKGCKQLPGYRALASDIFTIVPLFKEHWAQIEGKTPVTRAALADATSRAVDLMAIVGLREQGPESTSEVAVRRAKAFTLFLHTYDDARHAVEYLRRKEGDAAEIVPSLYVGRGSGRPSSAKQATPADVAATEAEPKASPTNRAAASPTAAPVIQINNPRGLPIDSPFQTE
jgi:hypothetical protein